MNNSKEISPDLITEMIPFQEKLIRCVPADKLKRSKAIDSKIETQSANIKKIMDIDEYYEKSELDIDLKMKAKLEIESRIYSRMNISHTNSHNYDYSEENEL